MIFWYGLVILVKNQRFVLMLRFFFLFYQGFFFTDADDLQDSRGREGTLLFYSTPSTRSRTFRHLFVTLDVKWLSRIFCRNACIYQTATRWYLPPYWITIWLIDWLIDWWCNVCLLVCLLDDLILDFCYSNLTQETGGLEL